MTPSELIERRKRHSAALTGFFSGPVGKEILMALRDELDYAPIKSDDPHETYYRLGKADAFNTLMAFGEVK